MKKLEKSQISELMKGMPMLDNKEKFSIVGGGTMYSFDYYGNMSVGYTEMDGYYASANGSTFALGGELNMIGGGAGASGYTLQGPGVNSGLFGFLASNTGVEWAQGLDDGIHSICTNKDENSVTHSGDWENTSHSQNAFANGMTLAQWQEVSGLPSQQDKDNLSEGQTGYIYNAVTGFYVPYTKSTKTQEQWCQENGFNYNAL